MKIICTTSDKYLHLIPVFTYLFNKYWPGQQCEIVGYKQPENLPSNFSFHSMGVQGTVKEWSTDLRAYFEQQDDWFIWIMEDTFFKKPVGIFSLHGYPGMKIGRIDLTNDVLKREHEVKTGIIFASPDSRYRLSTQPSIWNKEFLLKYLTPGMDPWTFETQDPKNDGWDVIGLVDPLITHNEGVRRFDPFKLNLDGMAKEDIDNIQTLGTWSK